MLKYPTVSLEDEEGSRLELLVSGLSTRGILAIQKLRRIPRWGGGGDTPN